MKKFKNRKERFLYPKEGFSIGKENPEKEYKKKEMKSSLIESMKIKLEKETKYTSFKYCKTDISSCIFGIFQNKLFIKTMFLDKALKTFSTHTNELKKTLSESSISQEKVTMLIKNYYDLSTTHIYPRKFDTIEAEHIVGTAKFIENMLFAEVLNQLFENKNIISIDQQNYKIHVSTLKDDQKGKVDIVIYNDDYAIGIDITTNPKKTEPSNYSIYENSIVFNYKPYHKTIYQFNKAYIEYLQDTTNTIPKPNIITIQNNESNNTGKLKKDFIVQIRMIQNRYNNTPSSPDQDTNNNIEKDQS